jgi:4-amino-4-deoxy-L-arabinose transferase-like glycosyltransferase
MKPLNNKVLYLLSLTFIVKLILLPFAQSTDADATSRVFISIDWINNPHWIIGSVWGPFHFYLNGIFLCLWNNRVFAPALLNIIISVLTLLPFYLFCKREFNEKGAFVVTCIFAASPILFHISFLALSETPYILFLVLSMNCISKAVRESKNLFFVLGGLCISLSAGFRFEAWLLIPVFTILIFCFQRFKGAFLFAAIASIYPLLAMIIDYQATGNALIGFNGNEDWAINAMGSNEDLSFDMMLRRLWSFPFFWMIAVGPLAAFFISKELVRQYRNLWTIPFWIIFAMMQYNAFTGTLMLHNRFVATWVVFSLPFLANYFTVTLAHFNRKSILFISTCFLLSFIYSVDSVKPLPRLKKKEALQVLKVANEKLTENSSFIIDFWTWENTYFVALNSLVKPQNIEMVNGAPNSKISEEHIIQLLSNRESTMILLVKDSKLFSASRIERDMLYFSFYKKGICVEKIDEKDGVILYLRKD